MKKYFDILELEDSASIEAVEQAYKELSNAWRPENYQNLPRYRRKAETKLKEINEAYERLKSYLAAKPHLTAQDNRPATDSEPVGIESEPEPLADRLLESEPETAPERPVDPAPWEPQRPIQASEKTRRSPIQITAPKSLVFGFVAILAVLGVLLLYRFFDRQKPPEVQPQKPVIQKTQPASEAGRHPAAAVRLKKAPAPELQTPVVGKAQPAPEAPRQSLAAEPDGTAESRLQKQPAAVKPSAPVAGTLQKINYQEALTPEILRPYNRNPARVRRVQKSLVANGYDPGPVDGIIGPYTSGALQQFAGDNRIGTDNLFAPDLSSAVVLYAEIAVGHPNWQQIVGSEDFARWLDSQTYYRSDQIQALKNSASARQVNDILELYKEERNRQSN